MLVCIKSVELLEFVVDLRGHLQADYLKRGPVGRLQALNREVKVGIYVSGLLRLVVIVSEVGFILFCLFFDRIVVLKHALKLVHLLHATRDLKSCDQLLF